MRAGTAARRNRIFESLSPDRQEIVLSLRAKIESGDYQVAGRIELVFDELLEEAAEMVAQN